MARRCFGTEMGESFVIRTAVAEDYDEVCALLAQVDELHRQHLPELFRPPITEPRSPEHFARLLDAEDSSVFVAEAGGLVGVAVVLLKQAPSFGVFIPQSHGLLDIIAVSPTWRRRGVGTQLTRAAELWARDRGARSLELGVYDFNGDARAFYEMLGYAPLSTKLRKVIA